MISTQRSLEMRPAQRRRRRGAGRCGPRRPAGRWGSCGNRRARAPSGRGSRTGSGRSRPAGGRSRRAPSRGRPSGPWSGAAANRRTWRRRTRCPGRRATGRGTADTSRRRPCCLAARARTDGLERIACREVDDVDGDAGRLGQADDPVGRLALEDGLARQAVTDRIGRAGRDGLGRDDVDGHPVLGVHHDQPAVPGRLLHRPEDRPVVAVEDARDRR